MGANSKEFLDGRQFESKEELEFYNTAEPSLLYRIETMLKSANLQHELKEELYRELKGVVDQERADELIEFLYKNQIDPITAGGNYSQTDIKNKLNKET